VIAGHLHSYLLKLNLLLLFSKPGLKEETVLTFNSCNKALYSLSIDHCKSLFVVLHVFKKQYVMFPFVLRKYTKIVEAYRKLVVGKNGKLVVEFEGQKAAENLSSLLSENLTARYFSLLKSEVFPMQYPQFMLH